MDIYQEALDYLQSHHVAVEAGAELEEDVFQEDEDSCLLTSLDPDTSDLPATPTLCTPEEMLDRRLLVLRGILDSEEVYLRELDALLTPMKALRASAGTSQPVLTSQQVQTVFYQVPEIRDIHQSFYSGLKARLSSHCLAESCSGGEEDTKQSGFSLMVGDLFLKMVNQLGVYGGFIGNYKDAVEVVRRSSHSDVRFRLLAESMMPNNNNNSSDKTHNKYTFEALLYKPLDRVTKTTLVLQDVLKSSPAEHRDLPSLQEALRLSRSFLHGLNESSQHRREVTLSHSVRRQLMRDGFVSDGGGGDGEHSLRHLFLYTDLLLCTRVKQATRGRQEHYRFCWYLPLARLRLRWQAEQQRPVDPRLHNMRTKMFLCREQLQQHTARGSRVFAARSRRKLEQVQLMLFTHSAQYRLELHSPSGRSHTLLFWSLYELDEWREAIHRLTTDIVETVPPDLLTLTSACAKLRMTQRPPLQTCDATPAEEDQWLCGTLGVAVHSACGLQHPASAYVSVEVDGYEFHDRRAQTHSSVHSLNPTWNQELWLQVDGAQHLRVLCVSQCDGQDDALLGKTTVQVNPKSLNPQWRRRTVSLGLVEVTLSLKFCPHPTEPPRSEVQPQPVFCVAIETVAQQEGVLVPHVVRCCVEEVERRGMDEVGIYRISGAANDITELKTAFDSNLREAVSRLRTAEVNAVAGVLKLYFRELPEPLMPAEMFQDLARMLDIQDTDSRLVSLLSALYSCPDPNRHTFLYLLQHLQRVSEKELVNKMSPINLATVFGPSLLRAPLVGLGHVGPAVDISQEVVVQVQVVFWYLQCNNLPTVQTSLQYDTDSEEETTHV